LEMNRKISRIAGPELAALYSTRRRDRDALLLHPRLTPIKPRQSGALIQHHDTDIHCPSFARIAIQLASLLGTRHPHRKSPPDSIFRMPVIRRRQTPNPKRPDERTQPSMQLLSIVTPLLFEAGAHRPETPSPSLLNN